MILRANILLLLTALIWGFGFIAQRVAMDHMGPYFFNALRFLLGTVSLLPVCWLLRKKSTSLAPSGKQFWILGGVAGFALFCGAALQQVGLQYTTAGKAGFITGLYLVIVPIIGFCLRQRIGWLTVFGALLATVGLYFLSVSEGLVIGQGDSLVLIGALFWAIHVQIVGHASKRVDPLRLAVAQYAICAGLNFILALSLEDISMAPMADAVGPILYAGLVSVGIAYTLQIVAQRHVDPSRAAILLSLEAVFAVLAGWLMLDEILSNRELYGCVLMFAGMMLSQLSGRKKRKEDSSKSGGDRPTG
jgi:drug/metabolite transporter (DMT)-like permease